LFAPLGRAGARPRWAAALAGGLRGNAKACPAQLGAAAGGDAAAPSVLTDKYLQVKNQSL